MKKKPTALNLEQTELVKKEFFSTGELPLVVIPKVPGLALNQWIAREKNKIESDLKNFGAILFRGFDIFEVEHFEKVVKSFDPSLLSYKERSTPRTAVSDHVYTATEYPSDQYIPLHNENSYSHQFPLKLWFCCLVPPETGGETPIADSRRVFSRLEPELVRLFNEKKVLYCRNFTTGIDLDWRTAFQTESRAEVEKYCREAEIDFEWKSNGGLQTRQIRPATIRHPQTNENVWFNQAHLFHVSSLNESLKRDLLETTPAGALTRNAYFGDGSEISESILHEIRDVYGSCQIQFKWEKGDVLLVDNILTCHARNPFTGRRRIVVAMSELFNSGSRTPVDASKD
ncbi:TauD/TfdA family dioxygenase [Planktothrix sp. FACHB-1355]|nr:TauD/TfdA family dioxygenase [Planktothrix sp. FACHB-1355]